MGVGWCWKFAREENNDQYRLVSPKRPLQAAARAMASWQSVTQTVRRQQEAMSPPGSFSFSYSFSFSFFFPLYSFSFSFLFLPARS
jgi:hypothetical protein